MELLLFIIAVFIISYLIGILFNQLKLPRLLGYLLTGLVIGNFFDFNYLITNQTVTIITSFALSVILLKAGLGIERAIIKRIGIRVLLLGTIPNMIEAVILATAAYFLLGFEFYEAFMFGFIISAVSPAVVIPSMTKLMDDGFDKEVTTLNLAATSFDDVVSLTFFSVFLALFLGTGNTTFLLITAPLKLLLGALIGSAIGFGLGKLLWHTLCIRDQIIQFIIIIAIAIVLKQYGHYIFIIEMIAIMTMGYYINDTNPQVGGYIKYYTDFVWKYAQVFLFFIIGFLANVSIIGDYLFIGIGIILLGLSGRTLGVILSLTNSNFSKKQKVFSVISNLPKATVQAVLGAVPLSIGATHGDVILSLSALAIIFTAPIGLLLIDIFSHKLLHKNIVKATS